MKEDSISSKFQTGFKSWIIGLLLIVLIGSSAWILLRNGNTIESNEIGSDLYKMNVVGKVKSLTEFLENKEDQGYYIQNDRNSKTIYNFNKFGNIENVSFYDENNSLDYTKSYFYNNEHQLIETREPAAKGERKFSFLYNKQKQLVEMRFQDYEYADTIFSYDNAGNLKTKTSSNLDSIIYKYDENNRLIDEKFIPNNDSGAGFYHDTFSYDEKGRLIKKCSYYKDSDFLRSINFYKYDDRNNVVQENYGGMNLSDGIKEILDNQFQYLYEDKYDFKYDMNGNWIKKTKSTNGEIKSVQTREYEYY